MQVTLFRPHHRQQWIAWLREKGWKVRHVYEVGKVSGRRVVMDAASRNWESFASLFAQKGMTVYLLSDGERQWDPKELAEIGIVKVITSEEEPEWMNAPQVENKSGKPPPLEVENHPTVENMPLSERWKRKELQTVTLTQEGDRLQEDNARKLTDSLANQEAALETSRTTEQEISTVKVQRPSRPTVRFPLVAAVYAAKGGVGKTVFLLHLAAQLAQHSLKVCVLDLDLQHGTVASTLHMQPNITITDLNRRIDNPKASRARLIPTEMGFSIVAAPKEVMSPVLTEEQILAILRFLKAEMDVVLIDTSTCFDPVTKLALEQADQLFLMTSEEVASLDNLGRMQPLLSSLQPSPEVCLVLNRVTKPVAEEGLRDMLPWPVVMELPEDPLVADAVRRGECAVVHLTRSPYCLQLETLVHSWTGVEIDKVKKSRNPFSKLMDVIR